MLRIDGRRAFRRWVRIWMNTPRYDDLGHRDAFVYTMAGMVMGVLISAAVFL